jgi:hypothetical protein
MHVVNPVQLLPTLYDISPFVDQNHPKDLHPLSAAYAEYWTKIERYCVEGIWGYDGIKSKNLGGWRYMPPQLAFMVNLCVVPVQKGSSFVPAKPFCHDLEWISAYNWLACRCFSGFEEDDEYSCFKPLQKLILDQPLTVDDEYWLDIANGSYLKKNGKLKEYLHPVTYLQRTWPEAMGLPLYHTRALDLLTFGSRGGTKTTFSALGTAYHEYKFYGAKRYNDEYFQASKNRDGKMILISSPEDKNIEDFAKVIEMNVNYHRDELGAYIDGEDSYPGAFHQNAVGKLEAGNTYKHIIKYKISGAKDKQQTKQRESGAALKMAISTTQRPAPGVGGRYTVMNRDEVGKDENLRRGNDLEEACMAIDSKFGSKNMGGTSGELTKVVDSQYYFYNPDGNNILSFPDRFENGGSNIAAFLPAYYVDRKTKNEMGNTDLPRALKALLERREAMKGDAEKLAAEKLRYPVIHSEMFGSDNNLTLPKAAASSHLIYLDRSKKFYKEAETGNFTYDNVSRTVKWVKDNNLKDKMLTEHEPQRHGKSLYGVPVIYEHPIKDLPSRKYHGNLYKVFGDPLKDDGEEGKESIFVGYVYKGTPSKDLDPNSMKSTIVASILCRRNEVEAGIEICFYFAMYYNAMALFEGNVGPINTLARLKGWTHLLQPTPNAAIDTVDGNQKKTKWGLVMTKERISTALPWLNEFYTEIVGYDEFDKPITRLQTILCRMQIQQISIFKKGKNLDTISAMLVLMYWLQQEILIEDIRPEEDMKIGETVFDNYFNSQTNESTEIYDHEFSDIF